MVIGLRCTIARIGIICLRCIIVIGLGSSYPSSNQRVQLPTTDKGLFMTGPTIINGGQVYISLLEKITFLKCVCVFVIRLFYDWLFSCNSFIIMGLVPSHAINFPQTREMLYSPLLESIWKLLWRETSYPFDDFQVNEKNVNYDCYISNG